jgi:uncharacterized LabA/DUF88 family protein
VIDKGQQSFDNFAKALKRAGYSVHKRTPKKLADGTMKANFDVDIAVDMMAATTALDRAILVSGDGDFVPLVKALQGRGVRVTVAMFQRRTAPELIAAADAFVALDEEILVEP